MNTNNIKKIMIFAAIIVAAIFLSRMIQSIDSFSPDNIVIVSQDNVGLYSSADESSVKFVTLKKGDKLIWQLEQGNWTKVTQGQFTGFVKSEYVTKSARFKEK